MPPSGKFRDLARQLPFIVNQLGCRIIHLLPVHPTPTTYARFGRFGSPYAALDLTAVDPALVEFDKRTTGIDQFCELTYAAHSLGARVFIDIVINHTGWGSTLQENHPEFFLKKPDGEFASPGAWGTVWEDLVELEQHDVEALGHHRRLAAGLVPARRGRFPLRRRLQNSRRRLAIHHRPRAGRISRNHFSARRPRRFLGSHRSAAHRRRHAMGLFRIVPKLFRHARSRGIWITPTARASASAATSIIPKRTTTTASPQKCSGVDGRQTNVLPLDAAHLRPRWSLLRNRLCALTSPSGGFGFTCGVEWLATEKIRVHGCTGLNWDSADNIVPELAQLNRLISDHPCFFDGAKLTRLSAPDSPVYALLRESAEGKDSVLVLVNTDVEKENTHRARRLRISAFRISDFQFDLLGQPLPKISAAKDEITFTLAPGAVFCLAPTEKPAGLSGENYRRARAQAALALESLNKIIPAETIDGLDWRWLAEQVERSPKNFLAAAGEFAARNAKTPLADLLAEVEAGKIFPARRHWTLLDRRRVTLVPPGHWLLIEDSAPFRATLEMQNAECRMQNGMPAPFTFNPFPLEMSTSLLCAARIGGGSAN